MTPPTFVMPFIRIALWIVLLVSAVRLQFLPGRHDPLATSLSAFATVVAFGGLLLVPIGPAWLLSGRTYATAKLALAVATFVAAGAALATANAIDLALFRTNESQ
jgi:hypothetical protein